MQFYGFFPRLILGAYFGYLFYWSRSLWLPIFAHMTNNAFAIVEYTFKRDYDENQMTIFGEIDEPMTYVMAAGSAFFFYLIVRYLYKFAGKKHESKAENPKTDTAINNEPS